MKVKNELGEISQALKKAEEEKDETKISYLIKKFKDRARELINL